MEDRELVNVVGGAKLSGSVISALVRAYNMALELGRSLGSYLRRKRDNMECSY